MGFPCFYSDPNFVPKPPQFPPLYSTPSPNCHQPQLLHHSIVHIFLIFFNITIFPIFITTIVIATIVHRFLISSFAELAGTKLQYLIIMKKMITYVWDILKFLILCLWLDISSVKIWCKWLFLSGIFHQSRFFKSWNFEDSLFDLVLLMSRRFEKLVGNWLNFQRKLHQSLLTWSSPDLFKQINWKADFRQQKIKISIEGRELYWAGNIYSAFIRSNVMSDNMCYWWWNKYNNNKLHFF